MSIQPVVHSSLNHSIARRVHAAKRAWERYAIRLQTGDVQLLERQIEERRALFICRASEASVVYLVTWRRFRLYAVYRRDVQAISTFLTAKQVRGYLR